jgi:hypothetical protein
MALQDDEARPFRRAARVWAVALLALLGACSSGPKESDYQKRMRLYREHYHEMTPQQRREYLSSTYRSPGSAERKITQYTQTGDTHDAVLAVRNQKMFEIERTWRNVEDFLREADEFTAQREALAAKEPGDVARKAADLRNRCSSLTDSLKQNAKRIEDSPFEKEEQESMLRDNDEYRERLEKMGKELLKDK